MSAHTLGRYVVLDDDYEYVESFDGMEDALDFVRDAGEPYTVYDREWSHLPDAVCRALAEIGR